MVFKPREENINWFGDNITDKGGRARAWRWYSSIKGKCEKCGSIFNVDIHHKDGNPKNNKRENIAFLCRSHHMKTDKRIYRLLDKAHKSNLLGDRWSLLHKVCINCGTSDSPHKSKGLCGRCYSSKRYYRYKENGWKWGVRHEIKR